LLILCDSEKIKKTMEFTADYEILKDRRPHWTLDERFNDFENSLWNEYFTFKEVCDLCQFESFLQQETIEDLEQEWSSLVRKWQRDRNMLPKNYKKKPVSALGFVGICFYYTLLHRVFDVIGKSKVQELFTLHEINVINLLYYYQYRCLVLVVLQKLLQCHLCIRLHGFSFWMSNTTSALGMYVI